MNVILPEDDFQNGIITMKKPSSNVDYTYLDPKILDDWSLSFEAIGLYAQIEMFYQEGKDLNQIDFHKCSCDDGSVIDSAWNELKEKGILQRFPIDNI